MGTEVQLWNSNISVLNVLIRDMQRYEYIAPLPLGDVVFLAEIGLKA